MLTRAILDTFPLIKFGAPRNEADTQMGSKDQDLEAYGNHSSPMLETRDIQSDVVPSTSSARLDTPCASTTDPGAAEDDNARVRDDEPEISDADLPPARPGPGLPAQRQRPWRRYLRRTRCPSRSAARRAQSVSSISRTEMTCACCHANANMYSIRRVSTRGCSSSPDPSRFADTVCQSPNSSAPPCLLCIAVLDFQALETMLAGEEPTERRPSQTPRFSRYLRFARRRHRHRMENRTPLTRGCRRSLAAQARDMSTDEVMNNVCPSVFYALSISLSCCVYTLSGLFFIRNLCT